MHGDNDPEIAAFFANFLGEGIRRIPPKPRRDGRLRQSTVAVDSAPIGLGGLALGLSGAAALIRDANAPPPGVRVPPSERTEEFYRMLEDIANDIMENGDDVEVASSREATPRLSPPTPPPASPRGFTAHGRLSNMASQEESDNPDEPEEETAPEPEAPELQKVAAESSSEYETDSDEESDVSDVVDATNVADIRYPPTDFGASRPEVDPENEIRVTVALNNGKTIMDKAAIDLDSSLEELFDLVETKTSKPVEVLITRHGVKLERDDITVRWSGLRDGDRIIAMYTAHPPAEDRVFQAVSPNSLAKAKFNKMFAKEEPVAMGAFGDVIAKAAGGAKDAGNGSYPSSQPLKSYLPLVQPSRGTSAHDEDIEEGSEDDAKVAPPRLDENWLGGLGLTAAIASGALNLNLAPPVPPSSEALDVPPDSGRWGMPAEFEDLGKAAQDDAGADRVSSNTPPQQLSKSAQALRKVGAFPAQPSLATVAGSATPTSSRLSDLSFAPTPSRKSVPATSPMVDREEFKKKMEDKQKANDAIWANIAATLEPVHPEMMKEPARRSFLSHTASAGSLKKKLPPMASTRR